MKTGELGPRIQVCWYLGKYPNHDELDNRFMKTKFEAYKYMFSHMKMADEIIKELCEIKEGK